MILFWKTVILCLSVFSFVAAEKVCDQKLHNCTDLMQPVLRESRYMFPTTQPEIEGMCKMWSHIMDCIRRYMADCSTDDQRSKFNNAVSNSIDSVHAICSSERYRRDYLENASCFKKVSMDSCGAQFRKMVDSAYNPRSLEMHICCAYNQYEKCVSEPIQRQCGPQALHLLDHSMASLKSRCEAITRTLKTPGSSCPVSETQPPPPPLLLAPQSQVTPRQPRTITFHPPSTSAYRLNPPFTTPRPWTPRTVIYPLPVTQYSRISPSWAPPLLASTVNLGLAIALHIIISIIM